MPSRRALLTYFVAAAWAGGVGAVFADTAALPAHVDGAEMSALIRTTMIALDEANATGNYTVLRDLAASTLRARDTAADLAAQFAAFRSNHVALSGTVLYDPVLDQKPDLSATGELHLVGHFATQPQQVLFDLIYQYELGAWHIADINIGLRAAPVATTTAGSPTSDGGAAADSPPSAKPPHKTKP